MQMQQMPQRPGRVAVIQGFIAGLILGFIESIDAIASQSVTQQGGAHDPTATFLFLVSPFIWVIGFLIVGTTGSAKTGQVSTGTLAGLFAGTVGGIIAAITQVGISAYNSHTGPSTDSYSLLLFTTTFMALYQLSLALGAGAGFGALGGLIGRNLSSTPAAPQQTPPSYVPPQAPPIPSVPPAWPQAPHAEVVYPSQTPQE